MLESNSTEELFASATIKSIDKKIDAVADDIGGLRDLFSRRLLNDKQKSNMIEALTDAANYSWLEPFLHDIILLLDRLEGQSDEISRSIAEELFEVIHRRGVSLIDVGEEFNPKYHRALTLVQSAEVEIETVFEVIRKGYFFGDKVIRPVEVTVASPIAKTTHQDNSAEEISKAEPSKKTIDIDNI